MRIEILTLFPKMFEGFLTESIIKRAIEQKKVTINIVNFREFSNLNNSQVDDTPYGGGTGMVLMLEPLVKAIEKYKTKHSLVILLTPEGLTYQEQVAYDLSQKKHLILICGHYEGFDERIKNFVDLEISIGDYVLTGGEIPAMVLTDSITRLLDGVINKASLQDESFTNNLLDYPNYTKPREFRGLKVPDVLLSGDHEKIKMWRKNEQIKRTEEKRKDLLSGGLNGKVYNKEEK